MEHARRWFPQDMELVMVNLRWPPSEMTAWDPTWASSVTHPDVGQVFFVDRPSPGTDATARGWLRVRDPGGHLHWIHPEVVTPLRGRVNHYGDTQRHGHMTRHESNNTHVVSCHEMPGMMSDIGDHCGNCGIVMALKLKHNALLPKVLEGAQLLRGHEGVSAEVQMTCTHGKHRSLAAAVMLSLLCRDISSSTLWKQRCRAGCEHLCRATVAHMVRTYITAEQGGVDFIGDNNALINLRPPLWKEVGHYTHADGVKFNHGKETTT